MSDRDDEDTKRWNESLEELSMTGHGDYFPDETPQGGSRSKEWLLRNASRLPIDWDSLPKPPPWSWLFGTDEMAFRAQVAVTVIASTRLINRPLSPPEVQSLSHHRAKAVVTQLYARPLYWLAAIALFRRGRATFSFPFIRLKQSFNPNVFPSAKRPWLRDNNARRAWHLLRFGTYMVTSKLFIMGFASSYTGAVMVSNLRRDPNLSAFNNDLMEHIKTARARREGLLPQEGHERDHPTPLSREGFGEDAPAEYEGGTGPMSRQPSRQDTTSPAANPPPPADDFTDDFDDASPVSPSHRPTFQGGQAKQVPAGSGSAWDRIRQRTQSAASDAPQNQDPWARARQSATSARPQPSARTGDGYSYSKADEEKSLAKDQAQKEFDDMLDRERRGGSDDIGGGRRRQ